jgi:cytochrome c peroxidase
MFTIESRRKASRTVPGVALATSLLAGVVGLTAQPASAQAQRYSCPAGFGAVAAVPVPAAVLLQSLRTVPNPVLPGGAIRADLTDFIANQTAAIQLGKALFWDMQAGSDNATACATCHFKAGADGRNINQLNPGANGAWDGNGANYTLGGSDFPFTLLPKDKDNVAGSQGVRKSQFSGFSKSGAELTSPLPDSMFNVGGVNVRQVTAKNTPSIIDAVFNHRQFWNGRAQPEFNGVDPFGSRSPSARVWVLGSGSSPVQIEVRIPVASLASQAVGPPLNTVEMSAGGRTFPDLGHKLLAAKPLGLQKVSSSDSMLGSLADTTGNGLKVSYDSLIRQAFTSKWWNYSKKMPVGSYSMMEDNFGLFWGLSIMLYESTLVADSSPMDQYLATRVFSTTTFDPVTGMPMLVSHDPSLLDQTVNRLGAEGIVVTRDDILNGLALFERPVAPPPSYPAPAGFGLGCIGCHTGAETTSASIRNLTGPGVEVGDAALKAAGFDLRMERMFMNLSWAPPGPLTPTPLGTDAITFDPANYAVNVVDQIKPFPGGLPTPVSPPLPLPVATYDTGWYNIGVRPTADDQGLGGPDQFGNPLSWTRLFQTMTPGSFKIPGNGLACTTAGNVTFPNTLLNASGFPLLSGPLLQSEATDVAGSFKVPGLRNVELNGPYMHHGGTSTLAQVIDFYDDGGNFANASKAPGIVPLMLDSSKRASLIAFLLSLTDERVRFERAPFDHPQLLAPNGDKPAGVDNAIQIPAVGASGAPIPVQRFLNLNPFSF